MSFATSNIFSNFATKLSAVRTICQLQRVPVALQQFNAINRTGNGYFVRNSNFQSSEILSEEESRQISEKKIEVMKNPEQWKYVERLIGPRIVNQVPAAESDDPMPSGWKPQKSISFLKDNFSYFVARTKNNQIPCYLMSTFRGQRKVTKLKHVQGDIWALEKELRRLLEKNITQKVESRVNEMTGQIDFKGAHVSLISNYLQEKGF